MKQIRQNLLREDSKTLFLAKELAYRRASQLQVFQLIITVLIPIVGSIAALRNLDLAPSVALLCLFALIADSAFVERSQSHFIQRATAFSEMYDCLVLEIDWNGFIAGTPKTPEEIAANARRHPDREKALSRLPDWYPSAVDRAPLEISRICCQRANLWYDAKLRGRYAKVTVALSVLVISALIIIGFSMNLTIAELVLSVFAPMSPLVAWTMREHFRQRESANLQNEMLNEVEALWRTLQSLTLQPQELKVKARQFQDAIFQRRLRNPLLFPAVYWLLRNEMDQVMNTGAEGRLKELGY